MKRATFSPELLLNLTPEANIPLRLQLEKGLRSAIQSGRLKVGSLLPSTRSLASDLGISRGVVLEAYEQLHAEGYLVARRGSATRVAARKVSPDRSEAKERQPKQYRYDFIPGLPDVSLFPKRAWLKSIRRALDSKPRMLDYPDPRGARELRDQLASYLNRVRATIINPDDIVICSGAAQGFRLVCEVLRRRGVRRIAAEDPANRELRGKIELERATTIPIPVDENGLRVDLLENTRAGAVLVTAAHQYPTGAVLTAPRRAALIDWATRRGTTIVEDDYDAEYRYDREPVGALQGLAPDRIIYMGTTSKTLAPALRLAWLALPRDLVEDVARAKFDADRGSPSLDQLALADFIERGELDRHLRRTRLIYRRRRDILVGALAKYLPNLRLRGAAAGLHVMIELERGADEKRIAEAAAERSIRIFRVGPYRMRSGSPALLIGYGHIDEGYINDAVRQLAAVISRRR